MNPDRLCRLLDQVAKGELTADAALEECRSLPFEDLGFAKIDHHRPLRSGLPEIVFGEGKSAEQLIEIARCLRDAGHGVLITRLAADKAAVVVEAVRDLTYLPEARVAVLPAPQAEPVGRGVILVLAAGTSDLPVAEEAALTAEFLGNRVERVYDVGVAGIHRLFAHAAQIRSAGVLIVVAGMEGALPSVVAGLVDKPVIAVPTSVGYGASFGGLAALLAMLNSCAAGVTVVNIDNGFGAGAAASLINRA